MSWETILGVITHPAVIMVVTAIAGVAIKGFSKYKKMFNEVVDVPRKVLDARKPGSPGGKTITEEEYAAIGKEIVDVAAAYGALKGTMAK
ncbi:MAG: hypothetical protein PHQ43_04520 [Dehalococcoidales bacterium]|nr:hypothetical protein [Dehalococcoidales bacterium]